MGASAAYPSRDGRQIRNASTWGEARLLYAEGWGSGGPGSAGVRGVRVQLSGTRVERVVGMEEVVVEVAGGPVGAVEPSA